MNLPDAKPGRWANGVTAEDMKGLRWTTPAVVVQIRFVAWTADGRLRQPSYLGIREDKPVKDVSRES